MTYSVCVCVCVQACACVGGWMSVDSGLAFQCEK
jgi:hypothetical protein